MRKNLKIFILLSFSFGNISCMKHFKSACALGGMGFGVYNLLDDVDSSDNNKPKIKVLEFVRKNKPANIILVLSCLYYLVPSTGCKEDFQREIIGF